MKLLITGGSGFIGTNLIEFIKDKEGVAVYNIDIERPKIDSHIRFWSKIDICNKDLLANKICEINPDYVIHLAARTDLRGDSLADYTANTTGVQNLLEVLDGISSLKRVIFTSSMYVCIPGYKPDGYDDYAPHTVYGDSKVITEKNIKQHNPSYIWSIIRPTSIWGPWFGEPYDKFFRIILAHSYFHMGERACNKTYGYIDNVLNQILSLLDAPEDKINKKIFYLGDYNPYNITEWANEISAEIGVKIPTIPYLFFVILGWLGDILKLFKVKFPMTSFRLKNMTTDNIHDLSLIQEICPNLLVSRIDGNKKTINWIKSFK